MITDIREGANVNHRAVPGPSLLVWGHIPFARFVVLKTIARALKPYAASRGFPVRNEPDMVAHPGGMRPRSPQRLT